MAYLYVPTITAKDGEIHPAKDDGGDLVDASEDMIGGINVLKYDDSVPRYVFDAPSDQPDVAGWETKTKAQVNSDYPGLIP